MSEVKKIFVYSNNLEHSPNLMGSLYVDGSRAKEILSFEFEESWHNSEFAHINFDPDLQFFKGRQFAPANKSMFGIFADASPDRWGRTLMKRREAILARAEGRKPQNLTEVDFLLGVFDETRMGAMRFALEEGSEFLSSDERLKAPPWLELRKLEAASRAFEINEDGQEEKWLKQLIAPGSSLGGARPKASVVAPDGSLWIAKFPSKNDEENIGAWEMVMYELAKCCKLNVPQAKLENFSKLGSTYLSKRFDRIKDKRIHMASAMTLLGKTDGDSAAEGVSYLDIASFIKMQGGNPKADLRELWKRIVFFMAVSNTDDHLRNHAFLLTRQGWVLSPLYDVNPNIYGESLALNVDDADNTISFKLALSVAHLFEWKLDEAKMEIDNIKSAVEKNWRILAGKYEIKRSEIEKMEPAFDMRFKI